MLIKHDDYDWANEHIVLFESTEELIVLHRNIMRNEEFMILTEKGSERGVSNSKYLLDFSEYEQLLNHEFKIRYFHKKQDNFKLFNAFFGQSVSEFFRGIVSF